MTPTNPHTPITDRPAPPTSRSSTTPRVTTRVDVELACLMCGRDLGMLESEVWPNYGPVVLHLSASPSILINDWRRLRCSSLWRCRHPRGDHQPAGPYRGIARLVQ